MAADDTCRRTRCSLEFAELQRVVDGLARIDVAASVGTTTESLRRWYTAAKAALSHRAGSRWAA